MLVSGENVTLAQAEVQALIRASRIEANISWSGPLAVVRCHPDPSSFILGRAALTKEAGRIIIEAGSFNSVIQGDYLNEIRAWVKPQDSFYIRVLDLTGNKGTGSRESAIRLLGELIRTSTGARVAIRNPAVNILLVLEPEHVLVCESNQSQLRGQLRRRSPGSMPFFHPSMMNSFLARVMCNLAGVMPDHIVLDPFCGAGGILCEVSHIGAKPVGLDCSWRLLAGARINLMSAGNADYSLIHGDAQSIPVRKCHCVVTDPPYGRSSSTHGEEATELVSSLLHQASEFLSKGGSMCLCGSAEMNVLRLMNDSGFTPELRLLVPVHSGLTREVFVLRF